MILPEDDKSLLKEISFVESGKTYSTNEMSCSRNIDSVNKKVNISYNVRDIDSEINTITPSFEYSLNGGSNWTAITAGCLEATDLDAKTVATPADPPENTAYTSYGAVWTPACESGISTTTYETDAQIRVRADDGQAAGGSES